jgi:hypothetical protein
MTDHFTTVSEDGIRFKLKGDGTWEPDIEIQSQPVDNADMDEGQRLYELAVEYANGSINVIKDNQISFQLYKQSAEMDYFPSFSRLSMCYLIGNGVRKDLNKALQWSRKYINAGKFSSNNVIMGYFIAIQCFIEVGLISEARYMYNECFRDCQYDFIFRDPMSTIFLLKFVTDVMDGVIEKGIIPSCIRLALDAAIQDMITRKHILSEADNNKFECLKNLVYKSNI